MGGDEPLARRAAERWGLGGAQLVHLGTSASSVWRCHHAGQHSYLRLGDANARSLELVRGELALVAHLAASAVPVAPPRPSLDGSVVETLDADGARVHAVLFEEAPGVLVERADQLEDEALHRAWGSWLGRMHRAVVGFAPSPPAWRWQWHDEPLLAGAEGLLPPDDQLVRAELRRILGELAALPRDAQTFGLIHADLGPQNFRYQPGRGVTAFDLDNACFHWFVSDVAIALSTLRRWPRPERDAYRAWMLDAYRSEHPLPDLLEAALDTFLQLRIVYVYLDRLLRFGDSGAPAHRELLRALRERVLERFRW
jgi:Ser/Thr protein kinase RdoA (MazF antagonist)